MRATKTFSIHFYLFGAFTSRFWSEHFRRHVKAAAVVCHHLLQPRLRHSSSRIEHHHHQLLCSTYTSLAFLFICSAMERCSSDNWPPLNWWETSLSCVSSLLYVATKHWNEYIYFLSCLTAVIVFTFCFVFLT